MGAVEFADVACPCLDPGECLIFSGRGVQMSLDLALGEIHGGEKLHSP